MQRSGKVVLALLLLLGLWCLDKAFSGPAWSQVLSHDPPLARAAWRAPPAPASSKQNP